MLPCQVGAIDLNRPGGNKGTIWKRAVRVNRPYLLLSIFVLSILFTSGGPGLAETAKAKPKKKKKNLPAASASASPGEQTLTNIPLPIGHEAKGLVLPDFDASGHLVGRFEAGTARRLDQEHVGFQNLKITTFTPE